SHGFAGKQATIPGGFTNIDVLTGPARAGGTLIGMDAQASWSLGAINTYDSTNTLAFSGFTNLVGGTVSDTFNIFGTQNVNLYGRGRKTDFSFNKKGASVTGSIDGGSGESYLHWISSAPDVELTSAGGLHGFNGKEPSIGGGFFNIDHLTTT